jgi:hypothetical protein
MNLRDKWGHDITFTTAEKARETTTSVNTLEVEDVLLEINYEIGKACSDGNYSVEYATEKADFSEINIDRMRQVVKYLEELGYDVTCHTFRYLEVCDHMLGDTGMFKFTIRW